MSTFASSHILMLSLLICASMWIPGCKDEPHCPKGTVPGVCGLVGKCVQCISDDHCEEGEVCEDVGYCMPGYYDGVGCATNSDCSLGDACCNGACLKLCNSEMDCWYDQSCTERDCGYGLSYKVCYLICESDFDCYHGRVCVDGKCKKEWCLPEGVCPEGWEPKEGRLYCLYDPCADSGLITAGCGLYPQCAECFLDSHCTDGICDLSGNCVEPECIADGDCLGESRCFEQRCNSPCVSDDDCNTNEICDDSTGHCSVVRCDEDGMCPMWRWKPVPGTLGCQYDPCPRGSVIPGVCAFDKWCVECIVDGDCDDGQFCSLGARCLEYPQCEVTCRNTTEICIDGKCQISCESDVDCLSGAGVCQVEGYCFFVRCNPDGTCPDGWALGTMETVPETLACVKLP